MKLAEKYNWPLWDKDFTCFFSIGVFLLSSSSWDLCLFSSSPLKGFSFFSPFFLNRLQIYFIHNCFLDWFPSVQICLLKHLSWTLSRLRMRQNKFALGNFILSTVFCGFHHHASRKIDASHIFWKELDLQGSHNQNKPACLQSTVHKDGSMAVLRIWVLLLFFCGADSVLQWETDQQWHWRIHPGPAGSAVLARCALFPMPEPLLMSELSHGCGQVQDFSLIPVGQQLSTAKAHEAQFMPLRV